MNMQSLRGIFPKPQAPPKRDFIKENVKNLRLMQQQSNQYISQANKSIDYERKGQPQRKIRSTSHSRLCSSTNSVKNIRTSKSIENVAKYDYGHISRPQSVQSRDACSQTESVDDELFLKDVIIRLPSASVSNSNNNNNNKPKMIERMVEIECPLNRNEDERDDGSKEHLTEVPLDQENANHVHEMLGNRTSARTTRPKHNSAQNEFDDTDIDRPIHQYSSRCQHSLQLCTKDNGKPIVPSSYRKGEIPKYLKEMKLKEIERNRLISQVDLNCPPGHTALSEAERLESLDIAQKKYQDLIDELNHMPLTSKTLRIRNRKIEIEKELRQLDHTIQIFSRSRVYVKNDD